MDVGVAAKRANSSAPSSLTFIEATTKEEPVKRIQTNSHTTTYFELKVRFLKNILIKIGYEVADSSNQSYCHFHTQTHPSSVSVCWTISSIGKSAIDPILLLMTIFRSQLSIYEIQTGTTLLHPPYKANMYYHSSVEVCVCVCFCFHECNNKAQQ